MFTCVLYWLVLWQNCFLLIENYKYSNCGKWKVSEADSINVHDDSPATSNDTSDDNNGGTSDEEYQSRYAIWIKQKQ
jgi:hypothetical protein